MSDNSFAKRGDKKAVEEGLKLSPKFDAAGLLPVVATDAVTGDVLMLAYMNAEALAKTIATGEAYYWSRSRSELWHKGATSGHVQKIVELRVDCDQDAIWLKVTVGGTGASCHVGYKSCFFRSVPIGKPLVEGGEMQLTEPEKTFDPDVVYGKN